MPSHDHLDHSGEDARATDAEAKRAIDLLGARSTPSETLAEIRAAFRDRFDLPDVQAALAAHASSGQPLLRHLSTSEERPVRLALARNRNTPEDVLAVLAADAAQEVRAGVAANPSTPLPVLLAMVDAAPTAKVTQALRRNRRLQGEGRAVLDRLPAPQKPKRKSVREHVEEVLAGHRDGELAALREDPGATIRAAAHVRSVVLGEITPEQCAECARDNNQAKPLLREQWAAGQDARVLETLILSKSDSFVASVIREGTPLDPVLIESIVMARLPEACWEIANRLPLDATLLRHLAAVPSYGIDLYVTTVDFDDEQPVGVVVSPGTPYPLDAHVTHHTQILVALHPETPDDVLDRLVTARSRYVRAALAERPYVAGLERLARDKEAVVRMAVARQESTPSPLLAELSADGDAEVRAAALDAIKRRGGDR